MSSHGSGTESAPEQSWPRSELGLSQSCLLIFGQLQEALEEAVKTTDDLIDTVMEEYGQWLEAGEDVSEASRAELPVPGNTDGCCSSASHSVLPRFETFWG